MRHVRTWILLGCAPFVGAILGAVGPGCGENGFIVYDCNHPIEGRKDHNGHSDACCKVDPCPGHCLNDPCPEGGEDAGTDAVAEAGASACAGDCAPNPPFGWDGPGLLWVGPEGTAPACPERAPTVAYQGHAELVAPAVACGSCSCSASSGTCGPPPHLTASSAPCPGSTGTATAFDGPSGWDGTCTGYDAIPKGAMCNTSPCTRSLGAAALAIVSETCTPSIVPPPQDPSQPSWMTAALACRGTTSPAITCHDPNLTCAPSAALPDFRMCIYQKDDQDCPASYPEKHLVFADFDDQRGCTPCTCDSPSGSSCAAKLSVFTDGACTSPLLGSVPISSDGPSCFDLLPAGQALGSKTITALTYQPGTCAPGGGQPTGSVEASHPSTFCCLPA